MTTRIALLGSTGSIGRQTIDVIEQHPDTFKIVTIAAGRDTKLLREQVRAHRPTLVVSAERNAALDGIEWQPTPDGLVAAATHPDVDLVVFATSGHDAIPATIEAIKQGKEIALANKEAIVCAGDLIMPLAREHGVTVRPIDSEHSAIWQSLASGTADTIERIILTASGGPFRLTPRSALASVTYEQALKHPNWSMGAKITVDSATLVNKGLELIEAHHLFDTPFDRIDVVVHPEQIIHSLIEFIDGNSIAQLSFPDMRLPIQYALTWPERLAATASRPLDLVSIGSMTFEAPDLDRFPALRLAREAGEAGRTYPTVYSAVDEIAVRAFASGSITFPGIPRLLETVMARHPAHDVASLDDVVAADAWARREASNVVRAIV
ncbi:MAG TPA: 1-deoxy-D-xylulose-5-phosphate reductoisomerase [Thermomicrobiales bacterium]|nr:1-deoxy-D-xylulose-5-phosphate reductoisomerase [Thermomicrobiales bacterium]